MPARPSTSGGPNGKASAFLGLNSHSTSADWRISRDDMAIPSATKSKKGLQPYRIGIVRGDGLPAAEGRPDRSYQSHSPPTSAPTAMSSPDDTAGPGITPIGMALGSPAHPPEVYSTWQPQARPAPRPLTPPALSYVVPAPTIQRQKTHRRKLFGGLFGSRKPTEEAKTSPDPAGSINLLSSVATPANRYQENAPARSNTVVDRKPPKHKPLMTRSNTTPAAETPLSGLRGSGGGKTQGWRPLILEESDTRGNNRLSPMPPASSGHSRSGTGPLLDVEIPSITLERYSVMFGSLLDSESSSSSLLARRQATLERLRTINEGISREEEGKERLRQRRATSPQPTKSPAFNLFPSTPGHQGAPLLEPKKLDARSRSHTSPALLPSPSRPSFDVAAPQKVKKTVTIISPRTQERQHPAMGPAMTENEARKHGVSTIDDNLAAFHFGPDVSGLILDSPRSISSSDDAEQPSTLDPHPLKPVFSEPKWEIVSGPVAARRLPPSSSSSTTTTSTRRSHSSSASSVSTHAPRPSVDIGESDAALKAAVEVSIARQISVSRQQRTLLRPLRTEVAQLPSQRTRLGSRTSPVEKMVIPRNEGRVVETKSGTPTVVVPRETLSNYPAAHRKSERVVLDEL